MFFARRGEDKGIDMEFQSRDEGRAQHWHKRHLESSHPVVLMSFS